MKYLKPITLFIIAGISLASSCKKTTDPGPDDFYFRCKINGQTYIPNSCANCITCTIYQDTIFIFGGNAGFETVGIGINDSSGIHVTSYILGGAIGRKGDYKNSTLTNDRYFTDATHTGKLTITKIDRISKIIEGNFYFNGYNSYRNDSVLVTEGKFRWKYTTS